SPVIALTKNDLKSATFIPEIYSDICPVIVCDYTDPDSLSPFKDLICGKVCAFTGNTGVGKSTLLNHISPELDVETSAISRKLGRGRHTTRVSRLYRVYDGHIADTPGFATFDFTQYADITAPELAGCFCEFGDHISDCRFADCSHTKERDCGVIDAVNKGLISRSRHESYVKMYDIAKSIKSWQRKNT
ncbi:MAG: ribosome small subunit-dependent GTPase A, partial [Oscillospiraceae bacterium]|nr:ribosome small subunit-dependent GTPase A [Oscillospiraceae bacterium]